jgi:hypothetical protein
MQATRALASSAAKGGDANGWAQRVDPLYVNSTSGPGQQSKRQHAGSANHRAAPGALEAVASRAMQPFLTQRKELHLDDNKSYRMPKQGSFDEQLFQGNVDSSVTPHGHSEVTCTDLVHGGDSR